MKKFVLLLIILMIGARAYSESRIIRTYRPLPPSYNTTHCNRCGHYYGHQNSGHRGYGYNQRYINSSYHPYGRSDGYNYQHYGMMNRFYNNRNNSIFRNNRFSPTHRMFERFRSNVEGGIVPISDIKPLKSNDLRLLEIEKNVLGKDYQKQDLNLRLNRLEKKLFKETYQKMNANERIDNLYASYNNQRQSVTSAEVSMLEKSVWGRSYGNESLETRVSKLEEEILGAIQNGDLSKRISILKQALSVSAQAQPYGTCYGGYVPEYDPNIVNDFHDGAFSRFKNNLGLIFGGGCPTGWSPQLGQMNQFDFMNDGDFDGYVGNTGYSYKNTKRGTGTGIRILD